MNNVFYELKKKGNVIHSTYAEIAKIRENHLGSPACNENMMSQEKSKTKWDQDVDVKKSKLNVNHLFRAVASPSEGRRTRTGGGEACSLVVGLGSLPQPWPHSTMRATLLTTRPLCPFMGLHIRKIE